MGEADAMCLAVLCWQGSDFGGNISVVNTGARFDQFDIPIAIAMPNKPASE